MSKQNLRKGIIFIFLANILNLTFNLVSNFLLPKYISVAVYADIKTFQLFTSYIGLLSFGYVDGIYMKYGGRHFKDINSYQLGCETSSFRTSQIIIAIILSIVSLLMSDKVLFFSVLVIVSLNVTGYIKSLYQATGEFTSFARATNLSSLLIFLTNVLLVFAFSVKNNSHIFLSIYVFVYLAVWLYLEWELSSKYKKKSHWLYYSHHNIRDTSKAGVFLMLGNFSSILLTSMDRWFVKMLFTTFDFAIYSFAVSIEGFLNVAVSPITVTLYNYFCRMTNVSEIRRLHGMIEIFSVFIVSSCFPAKLFLELFIPKYLAASPVMFLLFASQIFYIMVKSIYINLYKARGLQKIYFKKMLSVIAMGVLFNIIGYIFLESRESFALATLLSAIYWFFISYKDFKEIKLNYADFLYLSLEVILLVVCGFLFSAIVGFTIYISISILLTIILRYRYLKCIFNLLPQRF